MNYKAQHVIVYSRQVVSLLIVSLWKARILHVVLFDVKLLKKSSDFFLLESMIAEQHLIFICHFLLSFLKELNFTDHVIIIAWYM